MFILNPRVLFTMMKCCLVLLAAVAIANDQHAKAFSFQMQNGFYVPPPMHAVASSTPSSTSHLRSALPLRVATDPSTSEALDLPGKTKTLGLLTFDLDDSLYPLEPVLNDANEAFVELVSNYGYSIEINDIVEAGKRVREEAGPVAGTAMSHTDVRLEAIRGEMERVMREKKLRECAADWATEVESLTAPIRRAAEKWARSAVSQTVVESIYSAWERERHYSAERRLYPETLETLQKIKEKYPDVVIGAVTDGKANPMLMVFSLAPYFDFCMSWEDDAAGRTEFFKELSNVDGNADLQWIYRAAYEKYTEIAETNREMRTNKEQGEVIEDCDGVEPVWIHVGDDLAYDVGGSSSCGAKTILLDLDEEYDQTAKTRFGTHSKMPSWSTASEAELTNRKAMNNAAEIMVDKRIPRLSMLPDAIKEILKGQ